MNTKTYFAGILILVCVIISLVFGIHSTTNTISTPQTYAASNTLHSDTFFSSGTNRFPNESLLYMVKSVFQTTINKDRVEQAKTIKDLVDYYPENWIDSYKTVSVSILKQGEITSVKGTTAVLNERQLELLQEFNSYTTIRLVIIYYAKNALLGSLEERTMRINLTVLPQKEAMFKGGYDKMIQYLKQHSNTTILGWGLEENKEAILRFTINTSGEVCNPLIIKSTKSSQVDIEFIKLLEGMPKWTPAETNQGYAVEQEFEFYIGNIGC